MSKPYFATGYVRLLYRTVRAQGLSSQVLLVGTGADENDLLRADFEMPFASQMRLIENALAQSEPGLGLYTGRQLQLAAHGALGTAMQSAPDLRRGITTFVEFLPSRASFFSLQLVEEGELARVKIQIQKQGLSAPLVFFLVNRFSFHWCMVCVSTPVDLRNWLNCNWLILIRDMARSISCCLVARLVLAVPQQS